MSKHIGVCLLVLVASSASDARAADQILKLPFSDTTVVITSGWIYERSRGIDCSPEPEGNLCHRAIDFAKPGRTDAEREFDVLAAASGRAVRMRSRSFGNIVLVVHDGVDAAGHRLFTAYAHLKDGSSTIPLKQRPDTDQDIAMGQFSSWVAVNAGTRLGTAGATGFDVTGIHLHFEVHRGGYLQRKSDPYGIYNFKRDYPSPCVEGQTSRTPSFDIGVGPLWTSCPPVLGVYPAQAGVFDNFSRPDGPVGNGWVNMPSNGQGDLVIRSGSLSTPGPNGSGGVYRPVDLSSPITMSATFSYLNGFGGALYRYDTAFLFGSNGSTDSGYGVVFARGDQNYSDSTVYLVHDGAILDLRRSTFQFADMLTTSLTWQPDGSITGTVSGAANAFAFSFAPRPTVLAGQNFAVRLGFPDGRSGVIVNPTVDDVRLVSNSPAANEVVLNFTGDISLAPFGAASASYLNGFVTWNPNASPVNPTPTRAGYSFTSLGLKINGVDVSARVIPNQVTVDNSGSYTFGIAFVFLPWLDTGTGPDIAFCQATLTSAQPWSTGVALFRDLSFLSGVTSSRVVCQSMDPLNLVATLGALAMLP